MQIPQGFLNYLREIVEDKFTPYIESLLALNMFSIRNGINQKNMNESESPIKTKIQLGHVPHIKT